ncbi:tetratricopeptide repeat protein [Solimicrobium silvestre]|uniref:Uncharacterized protein n=1 Tax=Solimicrobium silvestre TaxID=2099400 RepID=A0A2S9H1V3_9BURK|nr:hypothetical protein [Solimicrobium silvestre]PRC93923.1 hypothetical protein S2091_1532 [Solimicrobium silvestre]
MTKPTNSKKSIAAVDTEVGALFEQALAASLQHQSEIAVNILNELLHRDPYHARARHLLGAEYAQAGNIDNALLELFTALELNPAMPLARFQLGLLLLTCARVDDAVNVWMPLDQLGNEHVLNRFRVGMLQMVQGNFEHARQLLATAMAENTELPELNKEMAIVIETIFAAANRDSPLVDAAEEDPNAQHILVSSYLQSPVFH